MARSRILSVLLMLTLFAAPALAQESDAQGQREPIAFNDTSRDNGHIPPAEDAPEVRQEERGPVAPLAGLLGILLLVGVVIALLVGVARRTTRTGDPRRKER